MHFQKYKRCKRYNTPGEAHELTFSCFRKHAFLKKERPCIWLADAINTARRTCHFKVWAFVFMPTHVHLLIYPEREEYSISRILQAIKQPVAQQAVSWLQQQNLGALKLLATGDSRRPYRFWEKGGGYDRNVNEPSIIHDMMKYIHNNPVRARLVEAPEDWYWSSARHWYMGEVGPIPIERDDKL